jgi:hypothetical protein
VKNDWENVGKNSNICIFHDVTPIEAGPNIVFNQIKGLKARIETTDMQMGIGIVFPKASNHMNPTLK